MGYDLSKFPKNGWVPNKVMQAWLKAREAAGLCSSIAPNICMQKREPGETDCAVHAAAERTRQIGLAADRATRA